MANQSVIQGMFLLSHLWATVLFDSSAFHSFLATSCVIVLGLKVESLEKLLHVSSPIGTRLRIDHICQDCDLESQGFFSW